MAELVIKLVNGELAGRTAQELKKEITACSQAANKATIGTQDWIDKNAKLADAKALAEDYRKQIDSTAKASDGLKQSFTGILNKIPGFSAISGAMQSATGGVGGLTSGFGLLKGAIISTGIGALLIAVTTLAMWFSKTEAGSNVLAGSMRALGAVVNLLFGKVMEIGKALFEAFSNPKQLLQDLVQFITDQVVNRFKAFGVAFDAINKIIHGDFKQGLKELADSAGMWTLGVANITDKVAKLGKEFADAAVEGYNFVQTMDDIEDRQSAMEITAKKNDILIDSLLVQAKKVSATFEEKIALLDKADALTRSSYSAQLKLSKEYLDAVNKEIDAEKKQQGVEDDTDEMRDKRKEAELAYLDILGQQTQLEDKIANRREQILGKQEKAEEKAAADLAKRLAEEEKARQSYYAEEEKIRELRNQAQEDSREKDLEGVKLSLQKQIEELDLNSPLYADHLSAAQELARKQRDDVNAKWDKLEADRAKKAADEQKKIASDKMKFEAGLAQVRVDTEKSVVDNVGQLLIAGSKNEQNAKNLRKTFAVADIGFNLGKELSANALAAAENPLNGITFGAAGAAQLAATNLKSILFAAFNVAKVLLFRKGGYTGAGDNDEPAGIVHKNEYVIPAEITTNPNYAGIINTLEAARLNGYQVGGPVNPYKDSSRPAVSSNSNLSSSSSPSATIDLDRLATLIDQKMENKIMRLRVINRVQDTIDGIRTINEIQNNANT